MQRLQLLPLSTIRFPLSTFSAGKPRIPESQSGEHCTHDSCHVPSWMPGSLDSSVVKLATFQLDLSFKNFQNKLHTFTLWTSILKWNQNLRLLGEIYSSDANEKETSDEG